MRLPGATGRPLPNVLGTGVIEPDMFYTGYAVMADRYEQLGIRALLPLERVWAGTYSAAGPGTAHGYWGFICPGLIFASGSSRFNFRARGRGVHQRPEIRVHRERAGLRAMGPHAPASEKDARLNLQHALDSKPGRDSNPVRRARPAVRRWGAGRMLAEHREADMSELPEASEFADLPTEIDTSQPHIARMYDYYLGGKNHFAADRELADKVIAAIPGMRTGPRENREFLGRAVRSLAVEAGIRQFLDIGTGLPTTNSVHEVAQQVAPSSRVVYVDNDPLVLTHARALLTSSKEGRTAYIQADLRNPQEILSSPVVQSMLDFSQPVALLLLAVLQFIPDEDGPAEIVATLRDALAPGSYLIASHVTNEHNVAGSAAGERAYQSRGVPLHMRESAEFADIAFTGMELLPPGVVLVSDWRPSGSGPLPLANEVNCYGGVARKL
jgi:SAM-dependent methyltransferase